MQDIYFLWLSDGMNLHIFVGVSCLLTRKKRIDLVVEEEKCLRKNG